MLQQNHGLKTTALPPESVSDNDISDVPTFMHSSRIASPPFDGTSGQTGWFRKFTNVASPMSVHRRNFMTT